MNAILTSLIAVLGTLLGSTVTHVFQQRSARRTEETARDERLRQERLDVYGTYAGLLVEFRQAMLHHWFCVRDGKDADAEVALRGRSFERRSAAQNALFRLHLITEEPEVLAAADAAFTEVGKLDRPVDREALIPRRNATSDLINAFVTTARRYV
ncbi:hypothetical protein [Streptomyces katrae]|uniref:hypothetical protein n=1 Tax=Streptomyces katrae TaxID=68223 RepID=UPI0004C28886|nr:hypothetical protein [Streptomyces katrae]